MCIKCEAKNGQQHQKWLFAVREINNRKWLYFNFSAESSSFIFNNFETEKFKLTFKGLHRPVCHLFDFTRVSSCKNSVAFHPRTDGQWSESWRRWCRVSFSVVLSLFLTHLRTLAQEKRSEICLRFWPSGPSLCFYPLLSRNIGCLPFVRINRFGRALNNGKGFSKISKPTERNGAYHLHFDFP